MTEVAQAPAPLSLKSRATLDSDIFVRACSACVLDSAEAVGRLKRRADSSRELLADATEKLEQNLSAFTVCSLNDTST
jgi:hypothetical protein